MFAPNDPALQQLAASASELAQRMLAAAAEPLAQGAGAIDARAALQQLADDYARNPQRWHEAQQNWYREQWTLWQAVVNGASEAQAPADRRFHAPEWRQPYFQWLAQSYLATSRWLTSLAQQAELDGAAQRKLGFLIRQWVDAASPANYPLTNPEALKLALDTQGASLAAGLKNLQADLPKGMVSMTDTSAFEVGRNLGVTPGAVVYENALFQLIQYRPATETVHEQPLLMVPPCINKFYILDLQPENSLVRYAVEQGHTVFMVSWRNAPPDMGKVTWDDYVEQGVITAIEVARNICGVKKINALGFCVGGTLLATALAVLKAKRKTPVAAVTLLATMLDFFDTGELAVFVDEAYVARREREFIHSAAGGVMHGRELAVTFASLRANDLIWNYVVNNYLKGQTPPPFDLLYWNCDSTNLPGAMYAWYVRHTYLQNELCVPGKLTVCGVPLDLTRIDVPAYLLATREDHIVPWKTAYASTRLLKGNVTFVLAASGHIAGVINPAARNKRNYWMDGTPGADAETWLAGATSQPGSWWTHWAAWLKRRAGKAVAARAQLGGSGYTEIEPAPGRYVVEKPPGFDLAQ